MRKRNTVTAIVALALLLALCICTVPAQATDIQINPSGPVYRITNQTLAWGISGGGGLNNNFFFSPLNINEYVCVYVYNNNPTNGHVIGTNISITANSQNITPSDGTWIIADNSAFVSPIKPFPSAPAVFNAYISGAVLVSVGFGNTVTQAGSPDTANVFIVQTQSACANVTGVQTNGTGTVSAIPPVLSQQDSNGNAFIVQGAQVNPAGNPALLVTAPVATGNHEIYFDRAIISCTATCAVTLAFTSGTCTGSADTIQNQNTNTSGLTTSSALQNCSTNPANNPVSVINLAANTPYTLDMKGMIVPPNTGNGYLISSTFTGTINVTFSWWEK